MSGSSLVATAILSAMAIAGLAASASAQPLGEPRPRAGQWEVTMNGVGEEGRSMTMKMCIDPTTQRYASMFRGPASRDPAACSKRDFHRTADGSAFESVCEDRRGGTISTNGAVSGDLQRRLHVVVDSKSSTGGAHHMVMDETWIGPCPAGGGGTVTLPNGQVITVPGRR